MKIKRFFAADMRSAIRQVRDVLGPDAVILSNKPVDGGVELMAAMDFDETAFIAQKDASSRRERIDDTEVAVPLNVDADKAYSEDRTDDEAISANARGAVSPRVEWSQDPILVEMRKEMKALRRMMENELSELTWRDMGLHRPQIQELLRRLM